MSLYDKREFGGFGFVQAHGNGVFPDTLYGYAGDIDAFALDFESILSQGVGNRLRSNRTVQLSVLARGHHNRNRMGGKLFFYARRSVAFCLFARFDFFFAPFKPRDGYVVIGKRK